LLAAHVQRIPQLFNSKAERHSEVKHLLNVAPF
jgi:hypothetical protein